MKKRGIAALSACCLLAMTATAGDKSYQVDESDFSIRKSLTGKPGDAVEGRALAINRKKGNCLACHTLPIPEQPFHGRIAPPLTGIGARYDLAQLRLRVVNPKEINPMSIMPAFYKSEGFVDPLDKFAGKSILSAQEIEDVLAYLATLK